MTSWVTVSQGSWPEQGGMAHPLILVANIVLMTMAQPLPTPVWTGEMLSGSTQGALVV